MEPITTAAVALAVAQGLSQVGGKLLEKGLVEPALEPAVGQMKSWLGRAVVSRKEDEALRKALRSAMEDYRQAAGDTALQVQTLLASLNILAAEKNAALRAEVARALWLMDSSDPAGVPETLPDALGLPSRMRPPLAAFLWHLKRQLAAREPFRSLFAFDQDAAVRQALGQMTDYLALLAATVEPLPEGPAMRRVLKRNQRKLPKVDLAVDAYRNAPAAQVRAAWDASMEALRPLLARIEATDRLIDRVVYQLYGLTDKEIAVVEGR